MDNKKVKEKILIAEDDTYISLAYKDGLVRAGFEVITATDGEEAIRKIKSEKPDLVLLDLIMPVKNGFDVLKEVCGSETLKCIPVIVLSNLSQESEMKEAMELGAMDYLVKVNLSMKELIDRVKSFFIEGKKL